MPIFNGFYDTDALRAALQALIDDDRLEHPASKRIADKIITDGDLKMLSEKQLDVFNRYIEPEFHIKCQNCNCTISLLHNPNALTLEGDLCEDCFNFTIQMLKD